MKYLIGIPIVLAALVVTIVPALAVDVEVIAQFDGGGSTAAPVTDVVDAYTGMAGDGWTGPWEPSQYTAFTYTATTEDTTPLGTGNGNYLKLVGEAGGAGTGASVHRYYTDGVNVTKSHAIEFSFRIDEDINGTGTTFTEINDRYQLFDAPGARTTANGYVSWLIGCYGGDGTWLSSSKVKHWVVYNGDNNVTGMFDERNLDTGIAVQSGTVYDFHIDIDAVAKTWGVTIASGGTTLYNSAVLNPAGLGWRTNAEAVGGLPTFGCYTSALGDTRAYSLDNLKITGSVPWNGEPPGGMTLVAAHFEHGNTDQQVDGFVGMPGNGWESEWYVSEYRTTVNANVVTGGDELKTGQGPYLEVEVDSSLASGVNRAAVYRDYKTTETPGIDWSREHTIQFTIRIDEDIENGYAFLSNDDRYHIFDTDETGTVTNSSATWIISAAGAEGDFCTADAAKEWTFYNGDRDGGALVNDDLHVIDTDILIEKDGVYDFTIVVDPTTQSYDATITYGAVTFTAEDLGWRSAETVIGGFLKFATRASAFDDLRAFSLDELIITQEEALPTIPGDTDGNNIVNEADAAVLANNWGANVGTGGFTMGDFNGDTIVDAADAAILAANWGTHTPPSESAAVPEPSLIVLLMAGLASLAIGRRR
ncbi:MAG: PEP-CTERM sorting domain-containing protein [Pirellulales bacterium]|nr:PEP-CTERM sorting domain-containing protein [Pirellulales bacterium]